METEGFADEGASAASTPFKPGAGAGRGEGPACSTPADQTEGSRGGCPAATAFEARTHDVGSKRRRPAAPAGWDTMVIAYLKEYPTAHFCVTEMSARGFFPSGFAPSSAEAMEMHDRFNDQKQGLLMHSNRIPRFEKEYAERLVSKAAFRATLDTSFLPTQARIDVRAALLNRDVAEPDLMIEDCLKCHAERDDECAALPQFAELVNAFDRFEKSHVPGERLW